MTIEKDGAFYWAFRCDQCDEQGTVSAEKADDFWAVVDHIKKLGWLVLKKPGGWFHFCDECKALREFEE